MTDIAARLRELAGQTDAFANNQHHSFVTTQQMARESAAASREAADEIERLRTENKKLWEGLDAMVNPKPDGNTSMRIQVGTKS